jgi:aspartate/methionine/tyrosine aminotransferase
VPGTAFGQVAKHHVRLSLASEPKDIAEGINRLCDSLDARKR